MDKAVCDDGTIHSDFYSIFKSCYPKEFYLQMLFHPFEKQLYFPILFIQISYLGRFKLHVVGKEG
jgi:hypothetical protein